MHIRNEHTISNTCERVYLNPTGNMNDSLTLNDPIGSINLNILLG